MSYRALLCAIWRNKKQRIRIYLAMLFFWGIIIWIIYTQVNSLTDYYPNRFDTIQPMNLQTVETNLPFYNIIFLKTHKTGSSAVTNVMQRFAKTHSLKAALPRCDHGFCYPKKFDNTLLYLHTESNTYNILFDHAVFNKENMLKIMESKKSTKIVTIIREPYSQFDSISQSYDFRSFYKLNAKAPLLDDFFNDSNENFKKLIKSSGPLEDMSEARVLSKNPNAFDMGFNVWNESAEYIKEVLGSIKKDFHLVMIMEYMEESLVLLKNELRCKLEDVVFYVRNETKEKNTADSQRMKKRVSSWNKMDAAIYNYFNETFWYKIKNLSASFHSDVKKLREYNRHLTDHCELSKMTELSVSLMRGYLKQTGSNFCFDFLAEDFLFTNWLKNMMLWEKMSANESHNKLTSDFIVS